MASRCSSIFSFVSNTAISGRSSASARTGHGVIAIDEVSIGGRIVPNGAVTKTAPRLRVGRSGHAAMAEEVRDLLLLERRDAREQVDLDLLAFSRLLPMTDGGEDRHHEVESRVQVGDPDPDRRRWEVTCALEEVDPTRRLGEHVLPGSRRVRPGLALARRRGIDDRRVAGGEIVVAEAEPVHHARAEVLDDDIGVLRELEDPLADRRVLEVDRDTPLVAVEREERVDLAVAPAVEDPPMAAPLALEPFELDHVGAEVTEICVASGPWTSAVKSRIRRWLRAPDGSGPAVGSFGSAIDTGGQCPFTRTPPSTDIVLPVMNDASSEARNAIAAATSDGFWSRLMMCRLIDDSRSAGPSFAIRASFIGVSTEPGTTLLNRMPRGLNSLASWRVSEVSAPFADE